MALYKGFIPNWVRLGPWNIIVSFLSIFSLLFFSLAYALFQPVHELSNNVVCATSKASDQPAHTRSLIRTFASGLSIL